MSQQRILIANRGEIALRIIRSAKEMDMYTIAVYSDADEDALHVKRADEAYYLGGSLPAESYRNLKKLVKAATDTKADLVHPGYGFLAENADFAKAIQKKGIIWIGPSPETIRSMGDKIESRKLVSKLGLNPVPGQLKPSRLRREAIKDAESFGYPVALKAAHGGGGKGLRIVQNEAELIENFEIVKRESEAYFGSDQIYVEKFIKPARHIETQILSDKYGNTLYLGERDCSLQRRNQKLIEESPPEWLSDYGRERLKEYTLKIASTSNYVNAGTVEFLADSDENFYFLEMNTRLQVEHTVTEMRYGIDLVKEQIKIALGNSLEDYKLEPRGHSIEFRINAEDPNNNFLPTPGTITEYREPTGNGVVWACDYDPDTGIQTAQRVFFHSGEVAGRPDGATIDVDGCYWFAGVGGWQIVRVTPAGVVDRIIEMPVEKPSKVMFGGAALYTLYVTSIAEGISDMAAQPEAGNLFAITGTGTQGLPQARFAG